MRRLSACLLVSLAALLGACNKPQLYVQESFVFGTRVEVLVAESDNAVAEKGAAAVLQEFDRLHRRYHAWQPSELTALNEDIAAGRSHKVSPELAHYIVEAQQLATAGERLFDPGIGGLVWLWGFHGEVFATRLPDAAALSVWRATAPSITDLQVRGVTVSSRKRGVVLDFGGYLKGVALDRAVALLHAAGVHNALVNIGGNVIALGSKYGEPWRVGIRHPRQSGAMVSLSLRDGEAIGTSGDYQRYFELDGKRYSHLLDPRTAFPVTHTESLSVLIGPRQDAGMRSDVFSKPILIAGPSDWRRMARQLGADKVLRVGADGKIQVTRAFAERLKFEVGVLAPEIVD